MELLVPLDLLEELVLRVPLAKMAYLELLEHKVLKVMTGHLELLELVEETELLARLVP